VTSLAGIEILPATVAPESRKEFSMIENFNTFPRVTWPKISPPEQGTHVFAAGSRAPPPTVQF
jgi:hypothetical protein